MLILNINWDGHDTSHRDILKFIVSIPSRMDLNELFETKSNQTYILRGIVCFLGAHYLSYIKHADTWKLYNDEEILTYPRWGDVVEKLLEFGVQPTLLVYERINESNKNYDQYDSLSDSELKQIN